MPLVSRPNRDGSGYLMRRARRVFSPLAGRPGQEQEHDSRDAVRLLLRVFRRFDFVGKMGTYRAVVEISSGTETYIPSETSTSTFGRSGIKTHVSVARLVTYLPSTTSSEELERLVNEIVSAHPWEHPVIEVDRVSLWIPS